MYKRLTLSMAICAALVSTTNAADLFGVASYDIFEPQRLYRIDTATGAATLVGNTGVNEINGIAWDARSNTLYGYTKDAGLYTIDLQTGNATQVADQLGEIPEGGLTFDSNGTAFAVNDRQLATIALDTGALSSFGDLGQAVDVSGLAFSPTGMLFGYAKNGSAEDALARIDPQSGLATEVRELDLNGPIGVGGLSFDLDGPTLYLSDGRELFTVNPGDGSLTLIGHHNVVGMSGIAFVPEPASFGLLVVGLTLGACRRSAGFRPQRHA